MNQDRRQGHIESLSSLEYPGRGIIIGCDISGKRSVVVYFITGRSPSSQARRLLWKKPVLWVKATDENLIQEDNRDLLIYPAIMVGQGIAVSNGKQTEDIVKCLSLHSEPKKILEEALKDWNYEPDAPIFTPRISGCLLPDGRAALHIIRREHDGSSRREIFEVPVKRGEGKFIATYSGPNKDPLKPFSTEPIEVKIKAKKAQDLADVVYESLRPQDRKKDFRVAVATIFWENQISRIGDIFIINRNERNGMTNGKS